MRIYFTTTKSHVSRAALCLALGGLLVVSMNAGAALAHHSFGMFEMQKTATVKGTVRDFQWTNPHVWIDLMVIDPATKNPILWSVEGGAIDNQVRSGWTRHSIKPGDNVELVVHPLRSGKIGGSLVSGSVNGVAIGHPPDWPK